MEKEQLFLELRAKKDIECDAESIPILLEIMETEKTAVKYQAEKAVRAAGEAQPALLYPYFQRIASFLEHPNHFIKWGTVSTVANLLCVDTEHLWYGIREKYLRSFRAQEIAEFGNAVQSVPKILAAYPEEEQTILPLLLQIDTHTFLRKGAVSPACLDVAKGHILDCFIKLFPDSAYRKEMLAFAERNQTNDRPGVRTKAQKLLNRQQYCSFD